MKQLFQCLECGSAFGRWPSEVKRPGSGSYCSRKCMNKEMTRRGIERSRLLAQQNAAKSVIQGDSAFVPLANSESVRVSLEDLEYVSSWLWRTNDHGYAVRMAKSDASASGRSPSRMHREIMARALGRPLKRDELIDHVNNDRLDNRRSNLRVCTIVQNAHNYSKYGLCTSKYKGVSWDIARGRWKAEIRFDKARWMIGRFNDEEEAAWMRDQWCLALHDKFAVLNFTYE